MDTGVLRDKIKCFNYMINGGITQPEICDFVNSDLAIARLKQAIFESKNIMIHCDIDMDGVGSSYIMYRFLALEDCANKVGLLINQKRQHGITKAYVDYINSLDNVGLLIIMDSSSNEIDLIKQVNTDVLVIDHHTVAHNELTGKTANGDYIIVNNMISGDNYTADSRFSAGLVAYELLRKFYKGTVNKVEQEKLYNWVAVTLFTDAVLMDNIRNQYYLQESVNSDEIEQNLYKLLNASNQSNLCKNSIQWYIAPKINSAIRAEHSAEAVNCLIFAPENIKELNKYKDRQQRLLKDADNNLVQTNNSILKDITDTEIPDAYCGVIASHLIGKYHKNTVVYKKQNGICKGSFRGRYDNVDYLTQFKSKAQFAQGHMAAFGFEAKEEEIVNIMNGLNEPSGKGNLYITAGNMPLEMRGKYHIENKDEMTKFKKDRHLLEIAIANSRLSTVESINIIIPNSASYTEQSLSNGSKVYTYDIAELGVKAISFDVISTKYAALYAEFINGVEIYIKEYN